ncbi:MAG TPA: TatD family hydrolase [Candidatus Paceibacterota bacterium]
MHTIDTHSHFNLSQFDADQAEAIVRMREAGVGTICIGIDAPTSEKAVALAASNPDIWGCVGQHPTEWAQSFNASQMHDLASAPRVVAIGECGLDYFRENERTPEAKEKQRELFQAQIELAARFDLPLMLHIRPEAGTMNAYSDALDMLEMHKEHWPLMRGTAHFFAGTKEIADRFLTLGFHISFSGVITFVPEYEELVAHVPLERILSETDAPFAAPSPYRGRRNEPSLVVEVVKKIAEIKNLDLTEVQTRLLTNAKTLFSLR